MHELSICNSVVDIVTRHAAGRTVNAVHLRVGALRQIVPDTLVYCWGLMNADTPLASSELVVESVPGAIRCRPCDRTQALTEFVLVCEACGGSDVEVVAGEEFLITTLDLAET
ncbi:hydrogenase maturation nickel metallochaperone HypA [Pseudonocardia sp.]|uniref:hydrogenase maturation nickel metallochaperone HypA n=1 Tax=Pseudonocardia sp. TaxID=60912 RepID=UPI00262DEA2E|nr:hydrogenase maturation nickel metallochaperone HypA [Pseudonocardia sp.]